MGRAEDSHNEPRPIDLDILLYGEEVIESPELTIPHPLMHERASVLAPLSEIAYLAMHPKLGKAIADLEDALGNYINECWEADEQM